MTPAQAQHERWSCSHCFNRFAEATLQAMVEPSHKFNMIYGIGDNPLTDIAGANAGETKLCFACYL